MSYRAKWKEIESKTLRRNKGEEKRERRSQEANKRKGDGEILGWLTRDAKIDLTSTLHHD